jgi:hypothetical protein
VVIFVKSKLFVVSCMKIHGLTGIFLLVLVMGLGLAFSEFA